MALQKFVKPGISFAEEKVAVWSKGQIGINRVLVEKRNLQQFKKAVLYFDPETKQMVFQFTADETVEGAVNISYSKTHVGLISAKPYLDAFDIDHSRSMKYPAHYDDKSNTLTLNVAEGTPTVSKRIKKAATQAPADATPQTPPAA